MRRRKSTIFFIVFGILLIGFAIALNVGWILLNTQQIAMLVLGIIFFAAIITGLVLNMIFLVREIRRNEQQDAFLNAMTHELKTPIASIRLYLETLKARDLTPERKEEFYDVMLADSDRLLQTVEQVLRASSSNEKSTENFADVELVSLVQETVELIRIRNKLSAEHFELDFDTNQEILVHGDRSELRTAFMNILDNAVKYSSKDLLVKIRIANRVGNTVEIYFKDNGIGFSDGEASQIFKRFYRVSNRDTKERKGTGLGLFIVRNIIKSHNGKVSATSQGEGLGATFKVILPVTEKRLSK